MDMIDVTALRLHIVQQRDSVWGDLIFAQGLAHLHCLDVAHMPGGLQSLPMCMLVHYWMLLLV